ncbi:LysR family transcriptional regulator [Parasphaerochaeta coccoides]|uniref:Transcriptional regulator, LysR family n=1 Tax=Parasphaerochaeta coccoides (strain ATCC BAA-1237 / DSM 17374 / SPN1) TaxID=760011 RepID=F4GJ92_PARC1|nr:LysR family transcriptional regulator [Parasphaerochaeta coccoides]AEC01732.1 transcriptional regulator, LysR family [Parasphaerochaeta coccoides DSM 17374]
MTLQQLKYVIGIVNYGSITEAAKQLFISQPSLSNAVKELENQLGIEIFNRSSKGITLSAEGTEFLSYARQVVEQADLLEQRYLYRKPLKSLCSFSTQHYAFAINSFVDLVTEFDGDEYEFTLRETRTYEIIDDVKKFHSEVGILYMSQFNQNVLSNILKDNNLVFHPLFEASPHIFISSKHPLAHRQSVSTDDLTPYPFLTFEQGEMNSFYFSEEMLSILPRNKIIHVSDRATLFNLVIGLNGYTISTGVLTRDLNGDQIIAIPLESDETMLVGWIENPRLRLSTFAEKYITKLKSHIAHHGFTLLS